MASQPKRARSLSVLVLILSIVTAALPGQSVGAADLALEQQTIKFYIDPNLAPDMDFARTVLPKYVADMNTVLAKNTRRQLAFDPNTGIILTSTKPQTDSATPPLPREGFEIWAHITQTTYPLSYGGYAGIDRSGAGVLAGLYWTRLYDPDHLASAITVTDYTIQLDHMLHEFAHVFGAGIGEYYNVASITDTTNTAPLQDIRVNDSGDPYWSDKLDFMTDPLLRFTGTASRSEYLQRVAYSNLTAAIINDDYRNGIASFDHYTVQVVDQGGQAIAGAEVKVWSVRASSPHTSQLLYDGATDENGQVLVAWGGAGNPHNVVNLLRLIKVYWAGSPFTQPKYVSIFDADRTQLVDHASSFVVKMGAVDHPPTEIMLSNAGIAENQPAGSVVGTLSAADPDAGDEIGYAFCGGADDAAFQLAGSELQSAVSFDYETRNSYSICLQADDGRGGTLQNSFGIRVNDAPEGNKTATFSSAAANDGWVLAADASNLAGGSINSKAQTFMLGSDSSGRQYRAVLSFNTSTLPDKAVITKAIIKMKEQDVNGADLFASGESVSVDVSKPYLGANAGLQVADFQASAGRDSVGMFGSTIVNGWNVAALDPSVFSLVNLKGTTQFRLRFNLMGGNSNGTLITFYSGNASAANRPVLTVEYYVP